MFNISTLPGSRPVTGAVGTAAIIFLTFGASELSVPSASAADSLESRSTHAVPPAWSQFAQLLQYRFREWLAADNDTAYRFHLYLENRVINESEPPKALPVSAWIGADGAIKRIEFPSLQNKQADEDLYLILSSGNIGEAPPSDMLQPVRLKLKLDFPK
jgi:hypothetical protein